MFAWCICLQGKRAIKIYFQQLNGQYAKQTYPNSIDNSYTLAVVVKCYGNLLYVICVDILFRDLEVNMYTHLPDVPQWLPTQSLPMSSSSLNSAYQSTPQSSSPLQLSSPCTPSGSAGSMLSGFGSMPCGSLPPDPFYNQPPMDSYQPLIDDYYNMSYHPTTR